MAIINQGLGFISETDCYWFGQGTHYKIYEKLGAHPKNYKGKDGYHFAVWAPHAKAVSIVGDFNDWNPEANFCQKIFEGGIWETFIPGLQPGMLYKFVIETQAGDLLYKADPYARGAEFRPGTASRLEVEPWDYTWNDEKWMTERAEQDPRHAPISIYECHLGSWKRNEENAERGGFRNYKDLAHELAAYVKDMGYTHVELMGIAEHPFDGSWGYQVTGYYAPTSRYGEPQEFQYFVDYLHQNGIGVILDWVPAHFPRDSFGLADFDGAPCYEYADTRKGEHPDWGTKVFDYEKTEVKNFLIANALYWLNQYHVDGLRVDAVASMLYLDYGRKSGEWSPNQYGGRENIEAIEFLRALNSMAFSVNENAMMVAEESTAWPLVTKPVEMGGLGFNFKWNMGWMNDMCHYLKLDPWFRQFHHKDITFSLMYAFSENFILPISHDEVVHMKGSLRGKMPGDDWHALAGVRGFTAYLYAHPGKQLTFMGAELGQWHEWDFAGQLDWYLLAFNEESRKLHTFFREINRFYLDNPELWQVDFDWSGFEWLVPDDNRNNVIVFIRRDREGNELIAAINFSPNAYDSYRFGVPPKAEYVEVFNTDEEAYGGSGQNSNGTIPTEWEPSHGRPCSISVRIPPYGAVYLRGRGVLEPPETEEEESLLAQSARNKHIKEEENPA